MAGIGNPYGAVPEALTNLRLSLSDVMNNIIKSKELDREVALEGAKAELQKAGIEADTRKFGMEQERLRVGTALQNQIEQARVKLEGERVAEAKAAGEHTRGAAFKEVQRVNDAHIKQMGAAAAASAAQARHAAALLKREQFMNQVKPLGEWATMAGYGKEAASVFGADPAQPVMGWMVAKTLDAMGDMFEKRPETVFSTKMMGGIKTVNNMMEQYKSMPDGQEKLALGKSIVNSVNKLQQDQGLVDAYKKSFSKGMEKELLATYKLEIENPASPVAKNGLSFPQYVQQYEDEMAQRYIGPFAASLKQLQEFVPTAPGAKVILGRVVEPVSQYSQMFDLAKKGVGIGTRAVNKYVIEPVTSAISGR